MSEEQSNLGAVFNNLMTDYVKLRNSFSEIEEQSQNIRILSFNSSIEAARAGKTGKGFQVIAQEIRKISESNKALNTACNTVVNEIEKQMYDLIGIRTADLAFDTIDIIDRNLFERYCDVQAWATFGRIIDACAHPIPEKCAKAEKTLSHLVTTYEVYHDIILTDANGTIISCGVRNNLVGTNNSQKKWFINTKESLQPYYSDMYFSEQLNNYVMTYACPVLDEEGSFVGVISSRFNWNFVLDIIKKAKISRDSSIRLINKDGIVIGSTRQSEILKLNLHGNKAFDEIRKGSHYGFFNESKGLKSKLITGFAKTTGYNSYKGKEWSVVIEETY